MINTEKIFTGEAVELPAMLYRREARVIEQRQALASGCPSVISFCLNIPGPVKNFPLAEKALYEGCAELQTAFGTSVTLFKKTEAATGCEAVFLCALTPDKAKAAAVGIEEKHPLGRLFDMDVLSNEGHISRQELGLPVRKCLLCGREAAVCGRSRAHSVEALQKKVADILETYFAEKTAGVFVELAYDTMKKEVVLTPKPGLVDLHDNGAHADMTPETFARSAEALKPWIKELYFIGRKNAEEPAGKLFSLLRETGVNAEQAMFAATDGVNTHKGLLFSLALLAGAAGKLQAGSDRPLSASEWVKGAAQLGKCSLDDLDTDKALCYQTCGARGARGEAAEGFPSVTKTGLPVFMETLSKGGSFDYAASRALLALIATVEDSNIIRRGGREQARFRQQQAASILQNLTERNYKGILSRLNEEYVQANLSPGGSADLLVLTLFIYSVSGKK